MTYEQLDRLASAAFRGKADAERHVAEVCRERDALKAEIAAEIAELRKDLVRLDWLITNEAYVASDRDREVFHIRWEFDCNDEESSSGVNQVGHFDSPREAIDAAMAKGKVAE